MLTDWSLIHAMMAAAIDTCEQLETMGYAERHRDRELAGASEVQPGQDALLQMIDGYRNHAIPDLRRAVTGTE